MIKIALRPFPGSFTGFEWRACAVDGCKAQVIFQDAENHKWVCFKHGQLILPKQWGYDRSGDIIITGHLDSRVALLEEFVRCYDAAGPYHNNDCGMFWCLEEGCKCLGENATKETKFEHPCSCGLDALNTARKALDE